jgi:hypothetical protein
MTIRRQLLRRLGCVVARTGTVGSAVMLLITVVGLSPSGLPHASAVPVAGQAEVVTPSDAPNPNQPLAAGGSATTFSLRLPLGAACTGDSALGGFRVQSYIVPASVDPAALTFDTSGPVPTGLGASFKQPLFDAAGNGYVSAQTANATVEGGPGPVVNVPGFRLGPPDVFVPGDIPAGTYNVGIACTKGGASATQLDKFWNTQLAVVTAAADVPAGVTWTAIPNPAVTTTTSTSSTSSTTTTTVGDGSTTTTVGDGSTTTTVGDGSTTTVGDGGTATTEPLPTGGTPTGGASVAGSVTGLPVTGKSTTALVVWSVLLLVFGRMAVLLGRPPRVRPAVLG